MENGNKYNACAGCHSHCHDHKHGHSHGGSVAGGYLTEIISLVMLLAGLAAGHFGWFGVLGRLVGTDGGGVAMVWYLATLSPVGWSIVRETLESWGHGDFFNEFTLMVLACAGAFVIGEYPEGVAVLLFYSFGEKLEETASGKARGRIRSLIDKLPDKVIVEHPDGRRHTCAPADVTPGEIIVVKPGERVALDGVVEGEREALFDTSALTGESVPAEVAPGGEVSSGYIPVDREVRVKTIRPYTDSAMNRIMRMIEDAASKKSHSETLLRRITRWYTPAVMIAAVALFAGAWVASLISGAPFGWQLWLNRSLVLLVCSCPCALVVSVPLSYFAAIGNASRFGVLFKGSRYLDALRSVDTLLLDKTGTITTGRFLVSSVSSANGFTSADVLRFAAALDRESSHPLAGAIVEAAPQGVKAADVTTVAHGLQGTVDGKRVVVGSRKLLEEMGVAFPSGAGDGGEASSEVCVAVVGVYAGSIYLGDTLKEDTAEAIAELHRLGIRRIELLSGDRDEAVASAAAKAGADGWHARLLPADKRRIVGEMKARGRKVAFVGDGINDAPSLAMADVGIAIGTGGTDVAMESADAVLTGNDISRIADAVRLSRKIRRVVAENVTLAIGVKLVVMILGAFGIATLWAAVFADTGITLITVIWTLFCLRFKDNGDRGRITAAKSEE